MTTGVHFFDHGVQTDHGGFISSDHGVQMPFGEGSKVNTPSDNRRRFSNRSKIKQGIPATANVPESLVFSGFPDILFIPFVSNKRFTFLCNGHKVPIPGVGLINCHNTEPDCPMRIFAPHVLLILWHISPLSFFYTFIRLSLFPRFANTHILT